MVAKVPCVDMISKATQPSVTVNPQKKSKELKKKYNMTIRQ